jgi:AcrR family transcriptional regulator
MFVGPNSPTRAATTKVRLSLAPPGLSDAGKALTQAAQALTDAGLSDAANALSDAANALSDAAGAIARAGSAVAQASNTVAQADKAAVQSPSAPSRADAAPSDGALSEGALSEGPLSEGAPSDAAATASPSRRRSSSTRQALLLAAAKLIAAKGYGAASMDEIAASAGFTKGALYSHFATKEDMAVAVTEAVAAAAPACPPHTSLRQSIKGIADNLEADRQLLLHELMLLALRSDTFRERVRPALRQTIDLAAQEVAHEGGRAEADGDDFAVAIGLFAIVNVGRIAANLVPDRALILESTDRLLDLLLGPGRGGASATRRTDPPERPPQTDGP